MQNTNEDQTIHMNDTSANISDEEYSEQKQFVIPLMSKKMNSIEKYVKINQDNLSSNYSKGHLRQNSLLSDHGSRLVYGGKITPDISYAQLEDNKCYVKYSSLQNYGTQQRLELLNSMGSQYERLKNGLSQKQPYLSKYSLKSTNKYRSKHASTSKIVQEHQFKPHQIQSQLKKSIVLQKGKRYFADLYMMKNERDKLKQQAIKGKSPDKQAQQVIYNLKKYSLIHKHIEKKQMEQKKRKMMKNKGLNWNVYYETLALTRNQKNHLKNNNCKFVQSYGTD